MKQRINVEFPAGVEGNRTLLSLVALQLNHLASMSRIANDHRKEIKLLAKRAGKSTLPWAMRRAING